jgi:hypothetical protein
LEAVGKKYQEAGIKISTCPLPFSEQDNLASFYESVRRKAIETARTWM